MTGPRVRRRRIAATVAAALVAAAWAGPIGRFVAPEAAAPASRSTYVVRDGDTLWSIAVRVAPGRDPRPLVDAIAQTNDVDPGAIVPGQVLLVPAGS